MKRLIVLTLFIAGCSTTQTQTQISQSEVKSEEFMRNIAATPIEGFDKANCKTPSTKYIKMSWRELVKEANGCVAASKWSTVYTLASELAQRNVNSPWGPYFFSLHAENELNYDRALWMLEVSAKRSPQVGLFHYQKGRILWKREQFKEATESLVKSIHLDTNLIDAHLFAGQIFFRDQDYSKAARHFQAVLRARPRDPTALMGLAECQIQTSDANGALELLKKGSRSYPNEPIFELRSAHVHENMLNDIPTAIEIYKTIASGYKSGKYTRTLDFSVDDKIRDLEMSVRGHRAIAGSSGREVVK